jgi:hypothetical protein
LAGPALRTGAALDEGRVVDLGREAKRQGVALAFDPASMIELGARIDGLSGVRVKVVGPRGGGDALAPLWSLDAPPACAGAVL